jgi:L-alanine-DL-glutamate epimerase-like enolase superfamily enzyme
MKVTSVEIYDINIPNMPAWHPVMIRVNTDEGISGLGEVGLAYGTGHTAGAGMVKNLAETFVLGADPFKSEKLWETMLRGTFWGQGGGPVVYGGMSAIDIAMWDIKGKAMGVPVYQLLGGKTNDKLRTYASQIQFGWEKEWKNLGTPEEYADAARTAVAEGYDCVKIDPIMLDKKGNRVSNLRKIFRDDELQEYYERVKAVRDAVGPNVDIILEVHSLPSVATGIQLGHAWEDLNCIYYEEPVHYINSVDMQEKVTHSVNIPMAAGERIYTRWGYRQFFEKQVLDVIQPDLCLVGGITEGKKVCDYAHVYDIHVQVHVCGSPISTAAALQLEAVIPNFLIHEHHTQAIKKHNRDLCVPDYQPKKGIYETPDLPGLGLELNDRVVKKSPCVVVKGG